ncbi:iron chelate uptake ABC transporter family permease subunit [Cohnella algarum]|uniref:iron chelate uptake ABC transporter family permease subunit n=1 Tax=Cohnella algarum TaxID=2044859 RepID=UPI0019670895|nr:iron ABC transporter permease [Cohnella algarum]
MTEKSNGYAGLNRRRMMAVLISAFAFALALGFDLAAGSSNMAFADLLKALAAGPNGEGVAKVVVWDIRLPMTLTCVFVGASLGVAGLQLQTITNNPLASPYTFGITASASFGAAISITTGFAIAGQLWLGTSLLAFLFALLVSVCIYYMGKFRGMSTMTLILTGIMMNFFFTALQQFLQYRASPEIAQIISGWTFGNLARSTWTSVAVSAAFLLVCSIALMRRSWRLTALSAGEEKAESLGVNVERLRFSVFVISAVLISGAVSFIGTVAFVGLVAPHCARLLSGDDQRFLLPLSMLFGGMLMLLSSIVSKLLSAGSMLPVGIITSIVGVPFLFILILRKRD